MAEQIRVVCAACGRPYLAAAPAVPPSASAARIAESDLADAQLAIAALLRQARDRKTRIAALEKKLAEAAEARWAYFSERERTSGNINDALAYGRAQGLEIAVAECRRYLEAAGYDTERGWESVIETTREDWRIYADRLIAALASLGLEIVRHDEGKARP